jgi:L-ascorbate metabolism protein UlaG (beta-lactamase superfamily)
VRGANTLLVVPGYIYSNNLSAAQKAVSIMLTNGSSTNVLGLKIESVPAYNGNHPRGQGNGYVLTMGGRRIYLSGDTGNIPEMHALPNIDVAFLCMNTPFTMTPSEATNAVRDFRPSIVYPYHYRNTGGATTNASYFKQLLGTGPPPGIEVRLRKWY